MRGLQDSSKPNGPFKTRDKFLGNFYFKNTPREFISLKYCKKLLKSYTIWPRSKFIEYASSLANQAKSHDTLKGWLILMQ
jgi:hypothetical protein